MGRRQTQGPLCPNSDSVRLHDSVHSSPEAENRHGERIKTMFCNNNNGSCYSALWIILILIILFGCVGNNGCGCNTGCGCNDGCC